MYLAAWHVTREAPALARDIAPVEALWRRGGRGALPLGIRTRLFAGPSLTVSGLHAHPAHDTLACQLRGAKEWLLFDASQASALRPTSKYGHHATMSGIDITDLGAQPAALRGFERARGLYARVEAGDVLFVPAGTWHAAVAAEPSLTVSSACARSQWPCPRLGGTLAAAAHDAGYGRQQGWCTCHETVDASAMDG